MHNVFWPSGLIEKLYASPARSWPWTYYYRIKFFGPSGLIGKLYAPPAQGWPWTYYYCIKFSRPSGLIEKLYVAPEMVPKSDNFLDPKMQPNEALVGVLEALGGSCGWSWGVWGALGGSGVDLKLFIGF